MDRSDDLKRCWDVNAALWTTAVREKRIPSRSAGTDQAIVDAVQGLNPRRVIDVGCGEGWLVRRLINDLGCEAVGIDGSAQLIANAVAAHEGGTYRVLTYERLVAQPDKLAGPYDVAICNFALFGESLAPILNALRKSLAPGGTLLIQSLHPWFACGDDDYSDGWRQETFSTLTTGNWAPMPWYFRTLGSWLKGIERAGLAMIACQEPLDPETRKPLSLILRCVSA